MNKNREKLDIQELSYNKPYHWNLKRIDNYRYNKITGLLARTITSNICSQGKVRIIDFGCGDGKGAYLLWKKLRNEGLSPVIVGCDISSKAVNWANSQLAEKKDGSLSFICGEIDEVLVGEGQEDRVPLILVMREVMEHLTENEIGNVLQKLSEYENNDNTWLLITVPTTNSPVEEKHYRHYNLELLNSTLIKNGFKQVACFGYGFRPRTLFKPLFFIKRILNRMPIIWRLMIPLWQVCNPKHAVTLICMGKVDSPEND